MSVAKPAYTMSINMIKAGHTIPDDLLKVLLTENRSAFGFVIRKDGVLDVERFGKEIPMEDIDKDFSNCKDILKNTSAFDRMFCFGQFPENFEDVEIQPFMVLHNSKKQPLFAVAIEGDFPGRNIDDETSEFFGVMEEYLGPKIEDLYKLLGNDPKKLTEAMRSDTFAKDLSNLYSHRGVIAILPFEGDPIIHGKNELGGTFDWGSSSNVYGFSAAAPIVQEQQQPQKRRSKYATSEDTPTENKPPEAKPSVPQVIPPAPTDPVEKVAQEVVEERTESPPANLHGKRLKQWYRSITGGDLPENWLKRPSVKVKNKKVLKDLKELGQTAIGTTVKEPVTATKTDDNLLPVMNGEQIKASTEWIKKHLDANSNATSNPLEMQKIEAVLPVFSEIHPGIADWRTFETSGILALIKSHPEAAWLMFIEARRKVLELESLKNLGDKKLSEITGTAPPAETKTTTTKTEPASPAPSAHKPRLSKYA